ncbi:tyrosine-type recombinase/integrase [Spirosoma sp. HMF4905]|uniref:Tyrosine-type recombinase/integrase n=1 Tax=Spirosoma arboris TaxID=2682092 RepID=A0A7K1S6M2_9BACT|nr:site-specific integrase [Spirosoma arboris]MVM29395.1 tyrosine-type recombinase/integrase [Spirosoma arboris]
MGTTQNFNQKVIIKDDYIKKDGSSALYIYVSIDGDWERLPLKLSWPTSFFDKEVGKILPRSKNDKDYSDYQLMINTEMAKVNEIFKEYRLGNKILTISQLLTDFNSFTSRKDFFTFFLNDANERVKRKKIEAGTRNGQIASLNSLKEFWAQEQIKGKKKDAAQSDRMPFNALTPKNLENFRAWLKSNKGNIPTTVENHMKNVRTYVKRALADGNVFDDPFKKVKVTKPETWPDVLTEDQLESLMKLFQDNTTPENWSLVLRHFLFSCFTGLRISDAKSVAHDNIRGDWLVIMPKKTLGKQKTIRVPLHPLAKTLIISSLGKLFDTFSEQYTNRLLTQIGQAAGVDFKVKTHTARHTFGTIFIELGGDVVTLKDYMGHRDLGTTMKYVHISDKRKKEKINVFDKLFQKGRGAS